MIDMFPTPVAYILAGNIYTCHAKNMTNMWHMTQRDIQDAVGEHVRGYTRGRENPLRKYK